MDVTLRAGDFRALLLGRVPRDRYGPQGRWTDTTLYDFPLARGTRGLWEIHLNRAILFPVAVAGGWPEAAVWLSEALIRVPVTICCPRAGVFSDPFIQIQVYHSVGNPLYIQYGCINMWILIS